MLDFGEIQQEEPITRPLRLSTDFLLLRGMAYGLHLLAVGRLQPQHENAGKLHQGDPIPGGDAVPPWPLHHFYIDIVLEFLRDLHKFGFLQAAELRSMGL